MKLRLGLKKDPVLGSNTTAESSHFLAIIVSMSLLLSQKNMAMHDHELEQTDCFFTTISHVAIKVSSMDHLKVFGSCVQKLMKTS